MRHWSEPASGAHFAAFEEPSIYASDLLEFLDSL